MYQMTERERQDEFVEMVGGTQKAEQMLRISQNSYPQSAWILERGGHCKLSGKEVFRLKAKREGFTDKQINCFLSL
jgi:hypothetical protein